MAYSTQYDHINRMTLNEAFKKAQGLDPATLKNKDLGDPEAVKYALLILAMELEKAEYEWS
jgi:hypothetical protein